ncbi:hypothetical protein FHW83_003097 [Duganella sp. SG902]|uniref:DUF2971 domain-containing protein n=1 Tax=Duganella sp. SG902 TaxID=2587016 RepID=UPI00159DD2A3|nr:DUF2971 domain-containing protein [Duganella sp. SG902]NVM77291.1 hypothetical protein [Duganella sp. SG902]
MPTIYHYCDASAFLSIIQNDALWLSSLYSMNDTGELKYFLDKALPAVRKSINQYRAGDGFEFFSHTFKTEYYGACFSTDRDDLYQWQAYGQRGKGLAIGFRSEGLCNLAPMSFGLTGIDVRFRGPEKSAGHQIGIVPVQYMTQEQIKICADSVAESVKTDAGGMLRSIQGIVSAINIISSTIKNEKFAAEKEYRLLYAPRIYETHEVGVKETIEGPMTERKWRVGAYGLTPYFEFKGVRAHVIEVTLGPNCSEIHGEHLGDFLRAHGMNVQIIRSKSTLR